MSTAAPDRAGDAHARRHFARVYRDAGLAPSQPRSQLRGHPDWVCRAAMRAVHQGKQQLRVDFEDNVIKLVRAIGRKAHATGTGTGHITYEQLGVILYGPDVIDGTREALERRKTSIKRWIRGAERAGLLAFAEDLAPSGKTRCLRWDQLEPTTDSADPAAVAAAIKVAELDVREPLPRKRRQAARWARRCPRAGRGSTRRLKRPAGLCITPDGSLSSSTTSDPPSRSGTPKGVPNSLRDLDRVQGSALDAIEAACPPRHRPALRAWRTAAGEEGGIRMALQGAAQDGALDAVPAALAAWAAAYPGREPRLSRSMAAQLERSAAQMDRCHGIGAGARRIVDDILIGAAPGAPGHVLGADEVREGRPIDSLAYYVFILRAVARQSRRHQQRRRKPRAWTPPVRLRRGGEPRP